MGVVGHAKSAFFSSFFLFALVATGTAATETAAAGAGVGAEGVGAGVGPRTCLSGGVGACGDCAAAGAGVVVTAGCKSGICLNTESTNKYEKKGVCLCMCVCMCMCTCMRTCVSAWLCD